MDPITSPAHHRPPRPWRRARIAAAGVTVAAAGAVIASGAVASPGRSAGTRIASVAHAQDAAYAVGNRGEVMEYVSSDGSSRFDSWGYTDPRTGGRYLASVGTLSDGTTYYAETQDARPSDGGWRYHYVFVDPIQRVDTVSASHASSAPTPGVPTAVGQLERQWRLARARHEQTATVNGVPTVKISSVTSHAQPASTSTLFVDPRSGQPVRFVWASGTSTDAVNWLPASTANIARAEAAQVPAGYSRVSLARFDATASRNARLLHGRH